ncbi:glycoside hydrolase family 2 sugar binding [Mucilaginibacter paludis DSM 18603]|uniref:Glycoside hydrolase family 2 sugar binding n=2 Tax=Mucilaginibacter TaxID=423349 RepID=H1YFM0_9SPHI|nr:glycoside hydrolase family 2 sugar binding [Mucilaginibacter paludis DSM 18603]
MDRYALLKINLALLLAACTSFSFSQKVPVPGRTVVSLNDQWDFSIDTLSKSGDNDAPKGLNWQKVNLPHTWNAADVMDDDHDYYRGKGWYKKTFKLNEADQSRRVFLYFKGANQQTEVYVNGQYAGKHSGGYTGFSIRAGNLLKYNGVANEIAVKVNNSLNEDIPPLTADFTFYGGIYRDVYLVSTNNIHFDDPDYGGGGVCVTTPTVSTQKAAVDIRSNIVNSGPTTASLQIVTLIQDQAGRQVSTQTSALKINAGQSSVITQHILSVSNPHLWSPDEPYLYTVSTRIYDARSHQLLDELSNPLGFRWFSFDAGKGFFLNGKAVKLIGASRHQDFEGLGNALPKQIQVHDIEMLKQMGANFLRVAHYPQDAALLEACDRLGIIASVEIPVVNTITESETFYHNCRNMVREMIHQNFNHPSILIWAYMNEIMLRPKFEKDKLRLEQYYKHVVELAQSLDDICRREDPSRYTMISNHGNFDLYNRTGLTAVPMLVGWNLYDGWYGKDINGFARFMDHAHQLMPEKPMLITEYGADADPRLHTDTPVRFDKTVEYAEHYHHIYLKEILKRPFVAGAAIWNLADFNSNLREESMPHINNKGLLTWNRQAKNVYYFYQANLLKSPFIKIASALWAYRTGTAVNDGDTTALQTIRVYTNLDSAQLCINGKLLGWQKAIDKQCQWQVPFINGENMIVVTAYDRGKTYNDDVRINFKLQPANLKRVTNPFTGINILLGSKRYFVDDFNHEVWQPDQPYQKGSWGFIGGVPYAVNNGRQSYGSDKAISGTANDPVFQTQQLGITQYRLDVPNGNYEITMDFAELMGSKTKDLAYNLSRSAGSQQSADRVFDVYINDKLTLEDFNIAEQYGKARAVSKKMQLVVTDDNGIRILFRAKKGEPVLNALQVKKIY